MFWLWSGFIVFVLLMLALDLGVFHRKAHAVLVREALTWTGVWISLALLFSVAVYALFQCEVFGLNLDGAVPGQSGRPGGSQGMAAAMLFLGGYFLEESLSMDNMFVIALILAYFRVPRHEQHRVLFWGILGALVLRAAMILAGVALVKQFDWVLYVFGAFLIFTAIKMALSKEEGQVKQSLLVRLVRRVVPVTDEFHGHKFTVRIDGRRMLTPLALALVAVESADVVFAVDSIPAILGVTTHSFLVFTSNVFAILGLRSLFFALAAIIDRFHYLKHALVVLLALIGAKMLLVDFLHGIPHLPLWTLGAIVLVLGAGIVASMLRPKDVPPA